MKEELREHLEHIAHPRSPISHPEGYEKAERYVRDTMESFGLAEQVHTFQEGGETYRNISWLLGPEEGSRLLIGAHLDAVPGSPGADDNGTGVAGLLELGRCLADRRLKKSVWLVLFTLEEMDITGSKYFARECRERDVELDLMISLEMPGYTAEEQEYPPFLKYFYPDSGDFIAIVGNRAAKSSTRRLCGAMDRSGIPSESINVPLRGWAIPSTRLSDHCRFWDEGYPAIMMTDTAFLRNPNYHLPSDRIETLDFEFLTGVVKGIQQFSLEECAAGAGVGMG